MAQLSEGQQEQPHIKRCPFHSPESNLSEVVGEWYSNQRIAFWAVFCEACQARGPEEATKEEAIQAWNNRPLLDRSDGATVMRDKCVEKVRALAEDYSDAWARQALVEAARDIQSLTLDHVKPGEM